MRDYNRANSYPCISSIFQQAIIGNICIVPGTLYSIIRRLEIKRHSGEKIIMIVDIAVEVNYIAHHIVIAMPNTLFALISLCFFVNHLTTEIPDSKRAADVRAAVWPRMEKELKDGGFKVGNPIYIRIFKQEHILEIWIKKNKKYSLFKTYPVCYFSGGLGTKKRMNDGKSPEGFYSITPRQLNPQSHYHLAINTGYPNQLEKLKGYTGTDIMIHGSCVSIGCYAMTDPLIEDIYTLVYKTFQAGQTVIPLHIFPFKPNADNMKHYAAYDCLDFWRNMKVGYDLFEKTRIPPVVSVSIANKQYTFK